MAEDTAFGLSRIGQISVNVHDLDRAAAWYRDWLEMRHLFTVPKMASPVFFQHKILEENNDN